MGHHRRGGPRRRRAAVLAGGAWLAVGEPRAFGFADGRTERVELAPEPPPRDAHLPAVIETVRRLPAALTARGLPLAEAFGAAAAHFWGFEDTAVNRRGEPIEP